MREERTHQRLIAAHDGFVKRGKARVRFVRVGALVEQVLDEIEKTRVCCECDDADAPGILIVDVRAGRNEKLR